MTKPRLKLVAEAPVDIAALIRADICRRDWGAVHVAADKRAPIFLPDSKRRWWLR